MQASKSLRRRLKWPPPFSSNEAELNADSGAMREAGKDAMFLADLEGAMADFHHVDIEDALA